MIKVNLDAKVKEELNSLSREEIDVRTTIGREYNHEILWYGIEGVAHFHIMQAARAIPRGEKRFFKAVRNIILFFKI